MIVGVFYGVVCCRVRASGSFFTKVGVVLGGFFIRDSFIFYIVVNLGVIVIFGLFGEWEEMFWKGLFKFKKYIRVFYGWILALGWVVFIG